MIAPLLHLDVVPGSFDHDHRFHHRRTLHGFVNRVLERNDLAAQPGAVAGDKDLALRVFDAAGQCLLGKAAIDHAMRRADFGASQHGDGDFRHTSHVDGDAIAFCHTHAAQHVGKFVDFLPQPPIRQCHFFAVFAFPDDSQLVAAPGFDMAVKGVEHHIGLATDKPLVEGFVAVIEDFVPFLIPLQLLGAIRPKGLGVFHCALIFRFVILHISLLYHFRRRVIPFAGWGCKTLFSHKSLLFVDPNPSTCSRAAASLAFQ